MIDSYTPMAGLGLPIESYVRTGYDFQVDRKQLVSFHEKRDRHPC